MLPTVFPKIKGYPILGVAGRGQFGRVLCAYQQDTGRIVALKELDKYRFPTNKLLRELRFMIGLQHPHIVACETILFAEGYRYLVMEYCEGGTLRDLMLHTDQLSVDQRLELTIGILQGLGYAHQLGIVHCDIKPENIMLKLTKEGWTPKIADFGIARLAEELGHHPSNRTGSPAYMSPERFYGQFLPSSDLYAVGIILYELFVQERPFQGTVEELMSAHLNQRPPLSQLPEPLQGILAKALAKLPNQRFSSAQAMADALVHLRREHAVKFDLPMPPINLVTVPPQLIRGQVQAGVWYDQKLWVAINRNLCEGETCQIVHSFAHPIVNLRVHGEWLYIQTHGGIYRYRRGTSPQLVFKAVETDTSFIYAISDYWSLIASASRLDIKARWARSSRSLKLNNHQILDVLMVNGRHCVALVGKSTGEQRLILVNRRAQVLGKLSLPTPVRKLLTSLTPYRLLVLEQAPSLLLMDLRPYRLQRVIVPLPPQLAVATQWGYAIASKTMLMLIDLTGQSLGNLQFPETIGQVIVKAQCELLVITHTDNFSYCYSINLTEMGIDLIC